MKQPVRQPLDIVTEDEAILVPAVVARDQIKQAARALRRNMPRRANRIDIRDALQAVRERK